MLDLKDIGISLNGKAVLKNISMSVGQNDTAFIIGQSGAGKSVLLKIMLGLLPPDSGKLLFFGQQMQAAGEREWNALRARTGVVFQESALFDSLTIEENVGIRLTEARAAPPREIRRMVAETLSKVGLGADVMPLLPGSLSGGMRKRAAIARAIIHAPEVVFYDEPTSGLDPLTAQKIDALIARLNAEGAAASVIVSHDMRSLKDLAEKVVLLREGRIAFDGAKEDFLASKDLYIRSFLDRYSI